MEVENLWMQQWHEHAPLYLYISKDKCIEIVLTQASFRASKNLSERWAGRELHLHDIELPVPKQTIGRFSRLTIVLLARESARLM